MNKTDFIHSGNYYEKFLNNSSFQTKQSSELYLDYQINDLESPLVSPWYENNNINCFFDNNQILKRESSFEFSNNIENNIFAYRDLSFSFNNEPFNTEYQLQKIESHKALNEARLNSYQGLFEKAWCNLKQIFTNQAETEQLGSLTSHIFNGIDDFDGLNDFEYFDQIIGSSIYEFVFEKDYEFSSVLSELFYFRNKINEVSKQIKAIVDIIKYLVHLLGNVVRNKRQYYRKISSIPFKNLDDYHSYNFISIN